MNDLKNSGIGEVIDRTMKTGSFMLNKGKLVKKKKEQKYAGLNVKPGGKTALVLSGGGAKGAYECGAWRALVELGVHIDMVVGVSIGALNGAMVVQKEPLVAQYVWHEIETSSIFDVKENAGKKEFAKEFFMHGGAGTTGMKEVIRKYGNDEAIRNSDIDFGILTVEFPSRTPCYMWKNEIPKGLIPEYIIASASAFPAIQPHTINDKQYIDGGYENNMPIGMAVEHGASDVIAINIGADGGFDEDELQLPENLVYIRPKNDLGDFLIFDAKRSVGLMRLGYYDTMKIYDVFEGNQLTFVKDEFNEKEFDACDCVGKIFDMDPLILYTRKSFMDALKSILKEQEVDESIEHMDFKDIVKEKVNKMNKKAMTLEIAKDVKEKGSASIFIKRDNMKKVFPEMLPAAKFLVANELV